MKKVTFFIMLFVTFMNSQAQELRVKSFIETNESLASIYRKNIPNSEDACALVRVMVSIPNITFDNSYIVGDVLIKKSEFWVYMAPGAKKLKLIAKDFLPLEIVFKDYGINKLEKLRTYNLVVEAPQLSQSNQLQNVIFNIQPSSSILKIDNMEYRIENGVKEIPLGRGEHTFAIRAPFCEDYKSKFIIDSTIGDKTIDVSLNILSASLKVMTNPVGAHVFIDDIDVGITPLVNHVTAGNHTMKITKRNYNTIEKDFIVNDSSSLSFSETLNQNFAITISSNVAAHVEVENNGYGLTPYNMSTSAGQLKVKLTADGYHDKNTSIKVDGTNDTFYLKMHRRFYDSKQGYLGIAYGLGNLSSIEGFMGGYLSNFNIDGYIGYGLDKKEKFIWYSETDTKEETYHAIDMGIHLGYAIVHYSRLRLTPQIGVAHTVFTQKLTAKEKDSNTKSDHTFNIRGTLGVKLECAFSPHFSISGTPEYSIKLASGKVYDKIASFSSKYKSMAEGFRFLIGLNYIP